MVVVPYNKCYYLGNNSWQEYTEYHFSPSLREVAPAAIDIKPDLVCVVGSNRKWFSRLSRVSKMPFINIPQREYMMTIQISVPHSLLEYLGVNNLVHVSEQAMRRSYVIYANHRIHNNVAWLISYDKSRELPRVLHAQVMQMIIMWIFV